jgi:hypothetical protein
MSTTLLDRIIEPLAECLSVDAAKKIVGMRADDAIQRRVDELAELANRGQLTPAEQAEYDRYLAAFHVVTIMQAKAKKLIEG